MADMLPYKASGCGCGTRSYGCACGSGYGAPRFVPAQPRHYAAAQEGEREKKGGFSWLALALAAGGVWVLYKAYADLPVGTTPGSYSEYVDRKYRRPL